MRLAHDLGQRSATYFLPSRGRMFSAAVTHLVPVELSSHRYMGGCVALSSDTTLCVDVEILTSGPGDSADHITLAA